MKALERALAGTAVLALASVLTLATGCTGGSETRASEEKQPARHAAPTTTAAEVNASQALRTISPSMPLYPGAEYRTDLTKRDEVMIRSQYGPGTEVYTLGTDDSFPQVFHYYTTFLAQYRAFPAQETYPPESRHWRTLEIKLDEAMKDPFIPGAGMAANDNRRVVLQIVETEAEPPTVIRYIVAPAPAAATVATASAGPADDIVVTR